MTLTDKAATLTDEQLAEIKVDHLSLGELIEALEAELAHGDRVIPIGFTNPHSYRGYYDQLAFEPARDAVLSEMLTAAKSALGATFQGWKGGDYTMKSYTECWLAHGGDSCGETIGHLSLKLMLAAKPVMTVDDLREQLAAIEHDRWSDWQRYMHGLCSRREDGALIIPAPLVARWQRQIATPYAELSEKEQQSDRDQVDRYWPLIDALREEVERLKLAHTTVSVALDQSGQYGRWARSELERLTAELAEAKATTERQQRHLVRANKHAKGAGEYAVKVGEQRDRILSAIHIDDEKDFTDWQRGYRACAENVKAAYTNAQTLEQACPNVSYYGRPCILTLHGWRQSCHFAHDPDEDYDLVNGTTLRDLLEAMSAGGRVAISAAMRWIEYRLHRDAADARRDIGGIVAQVREGAEQAAQSEQELVFRYLDMAPVASTPLVIPAEDDALYEQADQQLADIERRVALDRAVIDAAENLAGIERTRTPATEDSSIWLEARKAAVIDLIAAVDAHNTLDTAESPHPFVEMAASSIGSCQKCSRPRGYATHVALSVVDGQPDTTQETAP